jgi:hypothetical protein
LYPEKSPTVNLGGLESLTCIILSPRSLFHYFSKLTPEPFLIAVAKSAWLMVPQDHRKLQRMFRKTSTVPRLTPDPEVVPGHRFHHDPALNGGAFFDMPKNQISF